MSDETVVHVVVGETGEYSEYQAWIVCAYFDLVSARRHAVDAERRGGDIDDMLMSNTPEEARCNHWRRCGPSTSEDDYGDEYDAEVTR